MITLNLTGESVQLSHVPQADGHIAFTPYFLQRLPGFVLIQLQLLKRYFPMKYTLNRSGESTQPNCIGALTGDTVGGMAGGVVGGVVGGALSNSLGCGVSGSIGPLSHHVGWLIEFSQTMSLIQSYYSHINVKNIQSGMRNQFEMLIKRCGWDNNKEHFCVPLLILLHKRQGIQGEHSLFPS